MSGTFRRLILASFIIAIPLHAQAMDFDKDIQKQNNVYVEVVPNIGQKQNIDQDKANKDSKDLKVVLISKNY